MTFLMMNINTIKYFLRNDYISLKIKTNKKEYLWEVECKNEKC